MNNLVSNNVVLNRIIRIAYDVDKLRAKMKELSDEQLQAKTEEFKRRLSKGETEKDILEEAFAVVREASYRVLGMEPFRVQIMGGIALFEGRIAEMKTGEGKTLVAAMPSYLMALSGEGVHVVTVNDYLAKRDAEQIGQIHRFLGLSVGCVLSTMQPNERKKQYNCDITYITNNELGFDYLRDNMALSKEDIVQRGLHYAIIDEIDSILIDEAKTPLIISGSKGFNSDLCKTADTVAKSLVKGERSEPKTKIDMMNGMDIVETGDFVIDEKEDVIYLTEEGNHKVERAFGIKNLADKAHINVQHAMLMALKANYMMSRDQDYIVRDGCIYIVDEFTGRVMPNRRYSDGLHQAIEAKEGVEIQKDGVTLATITFQNFFNKYEKKSGMTGTALSEKKEFLETYHLKIVSIPTNRPMIRNDKHDLVYMTKQEKYEAVVNAAFNAHKKGQPVLVGTVTIDVSERLSGMFKELGIPHKVLNAKNDALEAEIISKAGQHGAITIATNMAGRGTDIILDDEAKEAGGLFVIGTERHDSRRIDDQLRGRSGRQGDPGESQFYLSLEDDMMRLFGQEKMVAVFKTLGVKHGRAVQHPRLTKTVEAAQKAIETRNFNIRKSLLDIDDANNIQREIIYGERRNIIDGEDMREPMEHMLNAVVGDMIEHYEKDEGKALADMSAVFPFNVRLDRGFRRAIESVLLKYTIMKADYGDDKVNEIIKSSILKSIDRYWILHLDNLARLRQDLSLVGYGQRDPAVEYRKKSFDMFNDMIASVQKEAVSLMFQTDVAMQQLTNPQASLWG